MGGTIEKANLPGFGYELHINQLKYELKSNIIPLGSISMGTFYHRALLFKVRFISKIAQCMKIAEL